jgi:hypothetical protein
MSYTMRKTPRSSFMTRMFGMGAAVVAPEPPTMAPPTPTVIVPPTAAPVATPAATSSLGRYVLWGGVAYLAYYLLSKE